MIFIKVVFKDFAKTLRAPPTDCFWKPIYCFIKKCVFQNLLKPFSIDAGKPFIILTAYHSSQKYFLEHLPMTTSGNVTKHAVSPQYKQSDGISLYNCIFQ